MEETVTVPARVVTVDYTGPCLGVTFVLLGLVIVALVVVLVRGRRGGGKPNYDPPRYNTPWTP